MERPYVICHILSSLDGKITGLFMGTEAVGALAAAYGKYRTEMNADAWLYGTTTTKEFTGFRRPAHVVEVLTASTSAAYKAYLRKTGVSYIIAGEKRLDCEMAMKKLHELFHMEKVVICGGGVVNWSFLQAGMVDELSLFLAPVTDGSRGSAFLFSQMPSLVEGEPV